MKDKIFGVLQRVGRSFMLPIAILPVAGLLLGLGGSFTNETMLKAYGLYEAMGPGTTINDILEIMNSAGNIIFANLPLIFSMGVAIGMAKKEKEVAALSAVIAFFVMHASIGTLIRINGGAEAMLSGATADVCGITSLQMGVFGGIIVGLGVSVLHNRYYKIELPQVLSFFGGTRFVPIVSGLAYVIVGIVMFYVWPTIQAGIYAVGDLVLRSGYAGTWVYGFMERLLIPFGLHHVFYLPFWQTAVGGTMEVGGQMIEGAQNIFFAQLSDPTVTHFAVSATRFMAGKFPLMIFGLPGAALAMYSTSKPEKRNAVEGLLLSAALTSMLTGITEPLEFTFIFAAPLLYGIHCVFAGFAYMLMHILNVGVGMTFSGGFIDLFLFGILQGNAKTSWVRIIPVTAVEDAVSEGILRGLGGKKNISDVDCCATRLRCTVVKSELVNDVVLKATGATGVVHKGNGVQIIYGPKVTVIKSNFEDYLETAPNEEISPAASEVETKQEKNDAEQSGNVKETVIISSPITGNADDLSTAPDDAFAGKMMGDGAVVTPTSPVVVAPEDGEVVFVFNTKHAIGFMTDSGVSVLMHIGIDTVKLDGKGFTCFVENGQKVKKGDKLLELDLEYLNANAPSLCSPILCTELQSNQKIRLLAHGEIKAGEPLYAVDTYQD